MLDLVGDMRRFKTILLMLLLPVPLQLLEAGLLLMTKGADPLQIRRKTGRDSRARNFWDIWTQIKVELQVSLRHLLCIHVTKMVIVLAVKEEVNEAHLIEERALRAVEEEVRHRSLVVLVDDEVDLLELSNGEELWFPCPRSAGAILGNISEEVFLLVRMEFNELFNVQQHVVVGVLPHHIVEAASPVLGEGNR